MTIGSVCRHQQRERGSGKQAHMEATVPDVNGEIIGEDGGDGRDGGHGGAEAAQERLSLCLAC
jgi:hypothetical protein